MQRKEKRSQSKDNYCSDDSQEESSEDQDESVFDKKRGVICLPSMTNTNHNLSAMDNFMHEIDETSDASKSDEDKSQTKSHKMDVKLNSAKFRIHSTHHSKLQSKVS